jgi:hypothetical protein
VAFLLFKSKNERKKNVPVTNHPYPKDKNNLSQLYTVEYSTLGSKKGGIREQDHVLHCPKAAILTRPGHKHCSPTPFMPQTTKPVN